jgi:prepilin-type N-terminal cleavage/methylation domain-containing protein
MMGLGTTSRGFTLIELLIAVVLLALLSSAAALSFVRPLRAAREMQALDVVRRTDTFAREQTERFGRPITLVFDLSAGTITRESTTSNLPETFSLREVRTGDVSTQDGAYALPISPPGLSRSYALHIVGPGADRWVLFAGLSGEMTTTDEATVDQLLRGASRHDAH